MTIKEEFEKAFKYWELEVFKNRRITCTSHKEAALWAAKWMAEKCANELYGQKIADGSDPGETIRQLSKELE